MSDLISRQEVKEILRTEWVKLFPVELDPYLLYLFHAMEKIENIPSAEPKDWMEQNKDRILQAGKEGREVEFRIDGRLFAIREKAQ